MRFMQLNAHPQWFYRMAKLMKVVMDHNDPVAQDCGASVVGG